ncbi:MAG: hypothetical protein KKE98_06165 [Nanoarchaeota archaeon]|nr:hypothetical protein [Nanoarchaeota archaeon]
MGLSRRDRREQKRKLLKEERLQQLRKVEEQERTIHQKGERKGFLKFYDKQYKKLLFIPFIILIIAIISLGMNYAQTGDFINRGVSLKGGIVITIPVQEQVNLEELNAFFKTRFPADDMDIRAIAEFGEQKAIMVTSENIEAEDGILDALEEKIPDARVDASVEITGSSLGEEFFNQILRALFVAFVFMGLVVFLYFGHNTWAKIISAVLSIVASVLMFQASIAMNIVGLIIGLGVFVIYAFFSIPSLAAILSVFFRHYCNTGNC